MPGSNSGSLTALYRSPVCMRKTVEAASPQRSHASHHLATMAHDQGWDIPTESEAARLLTGTPQRLENLGKSYMPIGYYRIDCQVIEGDTLYEFDTVHFVNITSKVHIEPSYVVAQLRHGEVVHVYGTGEHNTSVYDEQGTEVAPLASLRNGRKRVHVRLPYFGTTDAICGWMTAGAWMVPMQMSSERPFQLLTSDFLTNRQGITFFSWDLRDGPFTLSIHLNDNSALNPTWMPPTRTPSAFQFSSALGYLDIANITVPRSRRIWQPRGSGDDYDRVSRLEGQLLLYGGAHTEARQYFEDPTLYPWVITRMTVRSGYVQALSVATAGSVRTLAAQQINYNYLEDDDLQHLE